MKMVHLRTVWYKHERWAGGNPWDEISFVITMRYTGLRKREAFTRCEHTFRFSFEAIAARTENGTIISRGHI